MSATRLLRRVASLDLGELWLLVRMAGAIAVLPLFVRFLSLPRLVQRFDPGPVPESVPPIDPGGQGQ